MALSATTRRLLDIQGFDRVDDRTLAQIQVWLRVAPALCGIVAAVGTALSSPPILWSLAAVAALGAVLPSHPFDLIYSIGVRWLTGGPTLPANGPPRRFACALAAAWLLVTGALFAAGIDVAAYLLGGALAATAALVATTHLCIPSIMFRAACGQLPSQRENRV